MTKAEELAAFNEYVASLEAGYVKSILMDCRGDVESAIRSDFAFIPFRQRMTEQEEYRAELRARQEQMSKLKEEIRQLEWRRNTLDEGLRSLRSDAAKFARL